MAVDIGLDVHGHGCGQRDDDARMPGPTTPCMSWSRASEPRSPDCSFEPNTKNYDVQFPLESGDTLFLATDGFVDQLAGRMARSSCVAASQSCCVRFLLVGMNTPSTNS